MRQHVSMGKIDQLSLVSRTVRPLGSVNVRELFSNSVKATYGNDMHIWVDADACPNAIKEILFRAAKRTHCPLTLVANIAMQVPAYAEMLVVPAGFDGADNKIIELIAPGDLVITADIPLAAKVLEKEGLALNPRGDEYTSRNIGDRLSARNFLESFRGGADPIGGGPPPLNNRDKAKFANALDRFLAKQK